MDNNWHIVKEDERYVVLDNSSLSKLVPSITKLNPNKSTSGHKHEGQEEVYVFYKGTGIMQIDDSKFEYKDIDSKILLERVVDLIYKEGYKLANIDSTICLERPKISSYIPRMRDTIAKCMRIDKQLISIKATTTEKLSFVGREEGVSAYATVLITK